MKKMNSTFSSGYLSKYFQFFTCSLHYLCINVWIIVYFVSYLEKVYSIIKEVVVVVIVW